MTSATIRSTQNGFTYRLDIYLRASCGTGDATHPVIYATDGDAAYPPGGRSNNFKRILQRSGANAVLIGISSAVNCPTD